MSILIKGMEMPKTCDDCFLPLRYCPYAMKPNGECPLVPVPPHGRLIDADALVKAIEADVIWKSRAINEYDSGIRAGGRAIKQMVKNAPTVIEAEG